MALCRRSVLYRAISFQRFPLDPANRLPRSGEVNRLRLEQADDASGQSGVTAVPNAANGGDDPCLGQPFSVLYRQIPTAPTDVAP